MSEDLPIKNSRVSKDFEGVADRNTDGTDHSAFIDGRSKPDITSSEGRLPSKPFLDEAGKRINYVLYRNYGAADYK